MEGTPKKKKVVRAKSQKLQDPKKKQVITKKGNVTQKNAKVLKASKKENINPPTKETNKKPLLPPILNSIKSVKAGPIKGMETNTKRGKVPKGKKIIRPIVNPNKTGSTKIQTKTALARVDENKPLVTHNKASRGIRELIATAIPSRNVADKKASKKTIKTTSKNQAVSMSESEKSPKPRFDTEKPERNDKSKKESHKSKNKTGSESNKSKKMQSKNLMDRKYLALRKGFSGKKSLAPKFNVLGESHEANTMEGKNKIQRSYKTDLIRKNTKESGIQQNPFDFLLENYDNSENNIPMGETTHVNISIHEIKQYKHFNSVKISDEEHQKEGEDKNKFEDYQIQTENIYFRKNIDTKPIDSEDALVDAFELAMNDKNILLTLLRDQLDVSSSDGSTSRGMSSSSNPGVLIWEVHSSEIDGKKSKTEESSKPHYEDKTPVGYQAQDECSLKNEILEELMTAIDNSPDIPKRASQDQETTEGVGELEDYQKQDNSPMENTSSDNCVDNTQDADDQLLDDYENETSAYAAAMDNFVDAVNEVLKERGNEFEEGNDEIAEEDVSAATSSKVENYQTLLKKFPKISPSADVNNQHEGKNEKEYMDRLKSDIESTPSGGIQAMSKYFIDVLSLNKYLRYFNRSQVFKE